MVFEISIFAGACYSHQASFFNRCAKAVLFKLCLSLTRALCVIITMTQCRLQKVQNYFKTLCTVIGCQGCQFGFFEANLQFLTFFQLTWPFFIFEKSLMTFGFLTFLGRLDFLCRFGRLKGDFGWFLGTGRFISPISGHRMINFHWKLSTIIYNFLLCCFMLIDR